jgi:hypothetical protein
MADDLVHLAAQLVASLAPVAPWLVKVGEGAAEEAGSRVGGGAVEGVRRIWARLRPAVDADERASRALVELAAAPDDEDLRAQLRVQFGRLLAANRQLAASLARLLAEQPRLAVKSMTGIVNQRDVLDGQQVGIVLGDLQQSQPPRPRH